MSHRIRIATTPGSFEEILSLYKFRLCLLMLQMPCFHPSCCSLFILSPANKAYPVICFLSRSKSNIFKPCNILVSLITAGWQYRLERLMTQNEKVFLTHSNTFSYYLYTFLRQHEEIQTVFLDKTGVKTSGNHIIVILISCDFLSSLCLPQLFRLHFIIRLPFLFMGIFTLQAL